MYSNEEVLHLLENLNIPINAKKFIIENLDYLEPKDLLDELYKYIKMVDKIDTDFKSIRDNFYRLVLKYKNTLKDKKEKANLDEELDNMLNSI